MIDMFRIVVISATGLTVETVYPAVSATVFTFFVCSDIPTKALISTCGAVRVNRYGSRPPAWWT